MNPPSPPLRSIDELPAIGPAAVCMGVFDGVHRGHLALVATTVRAAAARGARSVALVFEPHPDEVVRPGISVPRLAPLAENLRRLEEAGIEQALGVRFDDELRGRTAETFISGLAPRLALRVLVMTPESAFGRGRAGTPEAMGRFGHQAGFDVVLADPVRDDGSAISSARIRDLIAAGDLEGASALLGRPIYLEARVAELVPDGRPGIVPLLLGYVAALPPAGRYAAKARMSGPKVSDSRELVVAIADGNLGLEPAAAGSWPSGTSVALELLGRC